MWRKIRNCSPLLGFWLRGAARKTVPNRESSGSDGVCTSVVPILEAAGHSIGLLVPRPNCASVQACRAFAAAGLMLEPSGRTTLAVFRYELAIGALGSHGIRTSTEDASGESTNSPCGAALTDGLNGTASQPDAPTAVVNEALASVCSASY